jgi:hypothetical protein
VVYVTPAPPTPSPIIVYVTPAPTPTAAPTDTPTPTPTSSPTPSAWPTSQAALCTGNASNKAFFVEAASNLSFAVYCAVLPSGWWLESGDYKLTPTAQLSVLYKNAKGDWFSLKEGDVCPPPTLCAMAGSPAGPASFGGLAGTLWVASPSFYTIIVGPAGHPSYAVGGQYMTQAQFVAWAAALKKVTAP